MYLITYTLVLLVFEYHAVRGDKSELCSSWSKIEDSLETEEFQFECKKDEDCQSLNCSGTTHGYYVNGRIQLYACDNPPSLEMEVNIPKLKINYLKKRIHHNDSISLTKNLNVEFKVQRSSQELSLGIFVEYSSNGSFPLIRYPLRIPVVSHIGFPIDCPSSELSTQPSVSVSKATLTTSVRTTKSFLVLPKGTDPVYSNCSITNSTCIKNEICQQTSKGKTEGICVCISSYRRDERGVCVYNPAEISTEGPQDNPVPEKKDTSNVSLLLTAILVPISVILILVGLVYASIRFRVFQHLRRRLRVQVYEHVLLGDDEDEDLTNPVA